jgi:hypothetical protein
MCSISELKQNPNAVIDALKAYDQSVRHLKDEKYLIGDSVEDVSASSNDSNSDPANSHVVAEVKTDVAPEIPDKKSKEVLLV